MGDGKKKDATQMMQQVQSLFYKQIAQGLTREERKAINERIKEEMGFSNGLGKEVTKAVFNFVCPEKESLVNAVGFNAHGNLNPDTGDTEAIVTVDCKACGKEHPIMAISFSEMLSMPCIEE